MEIGIIREIPCVYRKITEDDSRELGDFFLSLSGETSLRFGPHPLTMECAREICLSLLESSTERFVLESKGLIIGYFMFEFEMLPHEKERYQSYGQFLDSQKDVLFAPCLADKFQNKGLASVAMQKIIKYLKKKSVRSIVLLGRTQESNSIARAFYKKFGFIEYGGFQTEVYNIDMRLIL